MIDNGSQVTTTNKLFLLHEYTPHKTNRTLQGAGKKIKYKVEGQSYLMVPRVDGSFMKIQCCYTPTLPVTGISPGEHVQQNPSHLDSHTILSHEYKGKGEVRFHGIQPKHDDIFIT